MPSPVPLALALAYPDRTPRVTGGVPPQRAVRPSGLPAAHHGGRGRGGRVGLGGHFAADVPAVRGRGRGGLCGELRGFIWRGGWGAHIPPSLSTHPQLRRAQKVAGEGGGDEPGR